MPQRVCVQHPPQGRKVQDLETHCCRDQPGRYSGLPGIRPRLPVGNAPPEPPDVVDRAHGACGGHVVAVVESDERQVADMRQQRDQADNGPHNLLVHTDHACDPDDGVIEPISDGSSCGKVVELLGAGPVARVIHSRPEPGVHADNSVSEVELAHVVVLWDKLLELGPGAVMHISVQKTEKDRGGLLHAEQAVEGPFAVVLVNGLVAQESVVGDGLHAQVAAIVEAGPVGVT